MLFFDTILSLVLGKERTKWANDRHFEVRLPVVTTVDLVLGPIFQTY